MRVEVIERDEDLRGVDARDGFLEGAEALEEARDGPAGYVLEEDEDGLRLALDADVAHDVGVLQAGERLDFPRELLDDGARAVAPMIVDDHLLHREELARVAVQAEVDAAEGPGPEAVAARPAPREGRRGGQVEPAANGV